MTIIKKYLSPTALTSAPAEPAPPKKKKSKVPQSDSDFSTVMLRLSAKWSVSPEITLVWLTAAQFAADATDFETAFVNRTNIGSARPGKTFTLKELDSQVNAATDEVKVYVRKKFKTAWKAQLSRYGIVKESTNYRLPRDRDERLLALSMMIEATTADGFAAEEFGPSYWTVMKTNYTAALTSATGNDQSESGAVSAKDVLRAKLHKAQIALRFVIRGNYPDTYEAVEREWGWLGESY
jgi:hypothetical protein